MELGNQLKSAGECNLHNKKFIFMFLFIVSYLLLFSVALMYSEPNYGNFVHTNNKLAVINSNAVEHSPINITSDTELATMSTFGNGSATNPYIIENLVIKNCAAGEPGVNVSNTDKYFVLRNITVVYCYIGFFFSHVTYGSITKSNAINNTGNGFELDFSSNNVLTYNTASRNNVGFALEFNAYNNSLANNTANNNNIGFSIFANFYLYGIIMFSNNTFINNTATNNSYGFIISANLYLYGRMLISNNTFINNTATSNGFFGFEIADAENTLLITNTAINNRGDGLYLGNLVNTLLISNTAINNRNGFDLQDSANNILKNNIGIYNDVGDYAGINSANTTLINNKFIIINNRLADSFSTALFSYNNIIGIIILLGLCGTISYVYFNSEKKKIKLLEKPSDGPWYIGLVGSFLVILSTILPYITIVYGISVNTDIFQLSIFSGLLLLGGAGTPILSVLIYKHAKFFDECKIAEQMSLIGLIIQMISFVLMLLAYNDIINEINSIKNIASSHYIVGPYQYVINPSNGLFISLFGVVLIIIAYYYQRKENKESLQDELENTETIN